MSRDQAYCYPPDYTVLKNKAGLRAQDDLDLFERVKTTARGLELPTNGPISEQGFRAIHRHLFQDVFEWAGEYRTVSISKGASRFELPERIGGEMKRVFRDLYIESNLVGQDAETFAHRAAHYLDDLNITHPFREGNGRTQRVFLQHLAEQAGYSLEIARIDKDQWMDASIRSMHESDLEPMQRIITNAIDARPRDRDRGIDR